jgi:hypothetical protein
MAVSTCINCKSFDAIQQLDMAIAKFAQADFMAFIQCIWSAYIRKRRPLEINHCYNLNPGALC